MLPGWQLRVDSGHVVSPSCWRPEARSRIHGEEGRESLEEVHAAAQKAGPSRDQLGKVLKSSKTQSSLTRRVHAA